MFVDGNSEMVPIGRANRGCRACRMQLVPTFARDILADEEATLAET